MTIDQVKENIDDGLIRLQRQYMICSEGYDRPAFKDLAHNLRIWMDMRKEVDFYLRVNRPSTKFMNFALTPRLNRDFPNHRYLIVAFPRGVFVSGNDIVPGYSERGYEPGTGIYIGNIGTVLRGAWDYMRDDQPNGPSRHRITHMAVVFQNPIDDLIAPDLESINSKYLSFGKVSFGAWLDSAALVLRAFDATQKLVRVDISRENLVRRAANILGASHPFGGHELADENNSKVKELMESRIFNIPLPYIILLKMAQDILAAFK